MLGIIGGSGFYKLGKTIDKVPVITPYGHVIVNRTKVHKEEILFIPRHGEGHTIPPHRVNYRANLYALKKAGATVLFATYAAGIIADYKVEDLILIEDFIGFNAPITFFDDFSAGIKHTDFSQPFDQEWQNAVLEAAVAEKIKVKKGGIIATTHGPRFETKTEIQILKKVGANLVNMTSAYEITLAKELELPLAAVAIATNYATGINVSKKTKKQKQKNAGEFFDVIDRVKPKINSLLQELILNVETNV